MAQGPGHDLQRIGGKVIVIVNQRVVSWSRSSLKHRTVEKWCCCQITDLNTLSAVDVEITAVNLGYYVVNYSSSWNVLRLANTVVFIVTEKSSSVKLVDADEGQIRARSISSFGAESFSEYQEPQTYLKLDRDAKASLHCATSWAAILPSSPSEPPSR